MVKKLFSTVFIIFFILFFFNVLTVSVEGQTNTGPSPQLWRCLKAEQVGGRTTVPPPEVDVTLTGAGFPSLQDIHIVLCVPQVTLTNAPATNYKCTTGNSEFDRLIFGSDLTGTISPLTFEVPKGTRPPQTLQSVGDKIDTVVHMSHAAGHVNYAYFGVTVNEPQLLPGQGNTIQYGTFKFQQDPSGCLSIRWDPFGRVFDSQSLEPISGARVTLLDKNKQFATLPGLRNPETTEADGIYNFYVDIPGNKDPLTFYLNPAATNHTITADPNMHPNFDKAYYDIYKPDEPIVEAPGKPEHRDVPLDPGTNPPFRSTPVDMAKASVRLGGWMRYEGFVSHPLAKVILVGANSQIEVARTDADKDGFWTVMVPNSEVPQNEKLKTKIIKTDITALTGKIPNKFISRISENIFSIIGKNVSAQPIDSAGGGADFDPILSYVEGFAKDQNGNIIPNAIVKVKLEMSKGLYYQTTADENGFFTIPAEKLPIFDYYLEFSPVNGSVVVKNTPLEFVQNNEDHLTANNVNLMAATKNGESLIPTVPVTEAPHSNITPIVQKPSLFAGNNLSLIFTVIALVVLIGIAGGVLIYIKKKKQETNDLL